MAEETANKMDSDQKPAEEPMIKIVDSIRVDLTVKAPANCAIDAESVNGEVAVKDLLASIALKTVNGKVKSEGCPACDLLSTLQLKYEFLSHPFDPIKKLLFFAYNSNQNIPKLLRAIKEHKIESNSFAL